MLTGAPGPWADSPEVRRNVNLILRYYTNHRNRKESLLCTQNFTYLNGKGLNFLGERCEKLFPWVTSCPQMWKPHDKHTVHGMVWMPLPTRAANGSKGGGILHCGVSWPRSLLSQRPCRPGRSHPEVHPSTPQKSFCNHSVALLL